MNTLQPTSAPPVRSSISAPRPEDAGTNYYPALDAGAPSTLHESVGLIRRQLFLILGIAVPVIGVGSYLVLSAPPRYEATATVRLTDIRRSLTGELGAVGQKDIGMYTDPLISEIQVLRGRQVALGAAKRAGLGVHSLTPDFPANAVERVELGGSRSDTLALQFSPQGFTADGPSGKVAGRYGVPVRVGDARFVVRAAPAVSAATVVLQPEAEVVALVQRSLSAIPRENTNVVDVRYTAEAPDVAQRMANSLALEFQAANARSAQQNSRRRRAFLGEQLQAMDSSLKEGQNRLSTYRSRERIYSSRERFASEQNSLAQLDMRRAELATDQNLYRSLMERLERAPRGGEARELAAAPAVTGNPAVAGLYEQLTVLSTRRDSLTGGVWGSTDVDPDVQRLDALIASTRNRLIGAVREHVAMLDTRISSLDALRERSSGKLETLPNVETEEVRLVEEVEGTRRVASRLREEYERARLDEAVETGQVVILDPATAPVQPIPARRGTKLLMLIGMGLTFGIGAGNLRERMNITLRSRAELEPLLQTPVLAVVPNLGENPVRRWNSALLRSIRSGGTREFGGAAAELVTVSAPDTPAAEAFRMLRTNLILSQLGGRLRTLAITSAAPSEGKSTTAANLATALAQDGRRVILVDCDLRRGRQHVTFGVPRGPGLSDVVLGLSTLGDAVRAGAVENLAVLTAGARVPNPSELASSQELRTLLSRLAGDYDIVIIDAPPVLATAEATSLGKLADGVLLVVRAGQTTRSAAQQVTRHLRSLQTRVVGVVLNDPQGFAAQHEAYYGYYQNS